MIIFNNSYFNHFQIIAFKYKAKINLRMLIMPSFYIIRLIKIFLKLILVILKSLLLNNLWTAKII